MGPPLSIPFWFLEVSWQLPGNFQANRIFPCTPLPGTFQANWILPGCFLEVSRRTGWISGGGYPDPPGKFQDSGDLPGNFQANRMFPGPVRQETSRMSRRFPASFQEGCWKKAGMDIRISFLEVSWWDARRESALFRDFTVFSWILPGRFLGTSWILPGSFQGGGGHFCKTR